MNIYQLQYFRTMAKVQHYTKASKMLCITQPSLSNSIAALEDELGTSLFEKRGRNVVLSRHGKVFLTYVENALNELELGAEKVKELTGDLQLPINLGFIYTLSYYFIPTLIGKFKQFNNGEFANIDFTLHEGCTANQCTPELIRKLKNDELDAILISLLPKDNDIEFIPVCDQELVAIVPECFPEFDEDGLDLTRISTYPFIHFSGKSGLKLEINRMLERVNVTAKVCCEMEDLVSIAGLVSSGVGMAIVPETPVLKNYALRMLPIKNPRYKRKIYLGVMKNRYETLPIQQFKKFAIKYSRDIMRMKEH